MIKYSKVLIINMNLMSKETFINNLIFDGKKLYKPTIRF